MLKCSIDSSLVYVATEIVPFTIGWEATTRDAALGPRDLGNPSCDRRRRIRGSGSDLIKSSPVLARRRQKHSSGGF